MLTIVTQQLMRSNLLSNGDLLIYATNLQENVGDASLKGRSTKALPIPLASIERKTSQLFSPISNWDLHLDNILSKASSRLYILRVCKFYGLPLDHFHLLFTSLIPPIFTYAVQVS